MPDLIGTVVTVGVRAHVIVTGRVQGVFFRQSVADLARSRGVDGWVRNRTDGSVEAVFEGDADDVAACVEWCKVGPRAARVTGVDVDWAEIGDESGPAEHGGSSSGSWHRSGFEVMR